MHLVGLDGIAGTNKLRAVINICLWFLPSSVYQTTWSIERVLMENVSETH